VCVDSKSDEPRIARLGIRRAHPQDHDALRFAPIGCDTQWCSALMVHHGWVRPRPQQHPRHTRMPIVARVVQSRPTIPVHPLLGVKAVGEQQLCSARLTLRGGADQRGPARLVWRSHCAACEEQRSNSDIPMCTCVLKGRAIGIGREVDVGPLVQQVAGHLEVPIPRSCFERRAADKREVHGI
jgi:hypothetical protein